MPSWSKLDWAGQYCACKSEFDHNSKVTNFSDGIVEDGINIEGNGSKFSVKVKGSFLKKKHNYGGKSAPFAPRKSTSFLIRAKKVGGTTSLISPCPVTPAVLPTPIFLHLERF
ncbi:hypothetical protein L1887_10813 [Cichorium endivia]|nr:hypothetical protein L1887_10813 [Cichorium endivia]